MRPVTHPTPFCRPNSMRSLGSCCKLFRQAALASRTHSAGFDATTRRGFALPRAALNRRSNKEASRNVDSNGDSSAVNKVRSGNVPTVARHGSCNRRPIDLYLTVGKSLGSNTEGSQLPLRSRHYHAAWQCRTSKTVSCYTIFAAVSPISTRLARTMVAEIGSVFVENAFHLEP